MGLICINGARVAAAKLQDTYADCKQLIDIKPCAAPSTMLNMSAFADMESRMKTDEALWQEIEQTLQKERAVDAAQIRVHVRDGVVTLTGTVSSQLQKQAVEKALQGVNGCRALVMELTLPHASAYVRSDESLAMRIVAALGRVPNLPPERVRVETERGCVTLTGSVDTEVQRHEVASLVGKIEGVVGVSNRLTVREPPAADQNLQPLLA
jgi:osmotically-inducible protein OsmY